MGGTANDKAAGVGFTSDDLVVACGNFDNLQTRGSNVSTALGASVTAAAKLLKLSADGNTVKHELSLGDRIDDCELWRDPGGNKWRDKLVVGGTFGVAVINPAKMTVVWSAPLPGPVGNGRSDGQITRVSIDDRGNVVSLRNKTVSLFNHQGTLKTTYTIDRDYVNDVVMDPYRRQLYVVGYANRRNVNNNNYPVQVPFMYAFDSNQLNFLWRTWDYDANLLTPSSLEGSAPQNNMADSRMYRVAVGGDGKIVALGEHAGGNTVFRWNGKDFTTSTRIKYDPNSDTYNSGAQHVLYFAKVDAETGVVARGQNAVPRLDGSTVGDANGRVNTFRAQRSSLEVDDNGNIIIGAMSFYGTPERAENKFFGPGLPPTGEFVGPYQTEDMMLLQVTADLSTRIRWTPFARGAGGGGEMNAIAVKGDRIAVFGSSSFGNLMTTSNTPAPQPFNPAQNDSLKDAYLGVLTGVNP